MTADVPPSPRQLADLMLVEISKDGAAGRFDPRADRSGNVRSFEDLHDYVDANEYLIAALAAVIWDLDINDEAQLAALNAAADLVTDALAAGPAGIPEGAP